MKRGRAADGEGRRYSVGGKAYISRNTNDQGPPLLSLLFSSLLDFVRRYFTITAF